MLTIFEQFSLVLVTAAILAALVQFARQPTILAYIATGLAISAFGLSKYILADTLSLFASLGLGLLLFLVGIELKISEILKLSRSIILVGFGQIGITFAIAWLLATTTGFSQISAFYLAAAVTFSSTVIAVKLIAEKKDLVSLHGKITIGVLLIQDLVAIILLIILTQAGHQLPFFQVLATIFAKTLVLLAIFASFAKFAAPIVFKLFERRGELIILSSLAWFFLGASLGRFFGFTPEVGAFLAGLSLAEHPAHLQITARISPMRDFFVVIFFILLGFKMAIGDVGQYFPSFLLFVAIAVLGKILIIFALMSKLGFKNKTSFATSLSLSQISEFSLILAVTGAKLNHIPDGLVSLVTAIALASIGISTYLVTNGNKIYRAAATRLKPFEKTQEQPSLYHHYRHILVGCDRMGRDLLHFLQGKTGNDLVVVDFNPEVIKKLTADNVPNIFGDIADPEIGQTLNFPGTKLIISTVPDLEDNLILINQARKADFSGLLIATASQTQEAVKLYEEGADLVIIPQTVSGKHLARVLADHWENLSELQKARSKHLEELLEKD